MTEQTRSTINIEGALTFPNGFHVTSFSKPGPNEPTPQMTKALNIPYTWTNPDSGEVRTFPGSFPFIPGNSLRGRIRRGASMLVEASAVAQGQSASRQLLSVFLSGSMGSGNVDLGKYDFETYETMRDNLFAGILSVDNRYPGALRTPDMLPITAETVEKGYVPEHFADIAMPFGARQLLEVMEFRRVDSFLSLQDPYAPDLIPDFPNVHMQAAVEAMQNTAARKDSDGEVKKSTIENIMKLQRVIAGAVMHFRISAPNVTQAQAGFLVLALQQALERFPFGGAARLGMGVARGDLDVSWDGESLGAPMELEETQLTLSDDIDRFCAPAREAIAAWSFEPIDKVVRGSLASAAKKSKAGKKEQASA